MSNPFSQAVVSTTRSKDEEEGKNIVAMHEKLKMIQFEAGTSSNVDRN